MNANTAKAEEPIRQVIIHPPRLLPLLPPVFPATIDATNGVTISPMVEIKEASNVPKAIFTYKVFTTVPGIIVIGPKKISNIINGSLVILLKSKFKFPLIVSEMITNRKFKPIYASKLNPRAFPSPNYNQPFYKFVFTI